MGSKRKINKPDKCLNCQSENIIGLYSFDVSLVRTGFFSWLNQNAFVCVDCGYTMLFVRKEYTRKMIQEAVKQNVIEE